MANTRKAAVFMGKDQMVVKDVPMVDCGDDDVVVNIKAVGVCGSDVHFFKEGRIGPYVPQPGHIIGHESAGVISAVGKNVKHRKVGDRVAIEPGTPCGQCEFCQSGRYNLCLDMMFLGHPDPCREGAMAEYVVTKASSTFILPEEMSFAEGAMMEPLAVALMALKRGKVTAGMNVAILGSGPIGLSLLLACKAFGCQAVYMTDIEEARLEFAERLGATKAYNAKGDYISEILADTHGAGCDVVIEAAGDESAYLTCTKVAKRGGTIVFVGMTAKEEFPINVFDISDKELEITSIFRYANVYQQGINLASSGAIDMNSIITHNFPLDDVVEAIEVAHSKRDNAMKVVLTV